MFALTENGFGGVFLSKTDFCEISTHKVTQRKETHFPTCLFISKNSVQVFRKRQAFCCVYGALTPFSMCLLFPCNEGIALLSLKTASAIYQSLVL